MTNDDLISDLLTAREDLQADVADARAFIADIDRSIAELDAELFSLGYLGELEGRLSRNARVSRFRKYEFELSVLELLKKSDEPKTPRELAKVLSNVDGSRGDDREYLIYFTLRVRQCLVRLRRKGLVEMLVPDWGTGRWRLLDETLAVPDFELGRRSASKSRSVQTELFSAKSYRQPVRRNLSG